jgi:hypothetical protein
MNESALKKKVIEYFKKQGFFVIKISDRFRSGTLDLYVVRGGRSIWVELKAPGVNVRKRLQKSERAKLTLQDIEMLHLRAHGVEAYYVDSIEDAQDVVKYGHPLNSAQVRDAEELLKLRGVR